MLGADSAQAHKQPQQFGIDRLLLVAPVHAAAGHAGQRVEAGEIVIDRDRLAEAVLERIANGLGGVLGHVLFQCSKRPA